MNSNQAYLEVSLRLNHTKMIFDNLKENLPDNIINTFLNVIKQGQQLGHGSGEFEYIEFKIKSLKFDKFRFT